MYRKMCYEYLITSFLPILTDLVDRTFEQVSKCLHHASASTLFGAPRG